MKDNDLQKELMPFIIDVSQGILSAASCIRNHTSLILSLRSKGYSIKHIVAASSISYSTIQFSNKLSECKRASFSNNTKNVITASKNIEPTNIKKESKKTTEIDTATWKRTFNFYENYHENALIGIIPILVKAGWNTENYHLLQDKFNITTLKELITVVDVEIKNYRFRKNIFKDGKAFFSK